jgi:hypothetical protein
MGFWEKILPGYKGYKERENARNTDKILREFLSSKLKETRAHYDDFKVELTRRGNLGLMNPAEKVTQTLSRVIDRLRYANYGFSGKWFGEKIGVSELDQVHDFDKQLATRIDQIDQDIRKLDGLDDDDAITAALKAAAVLIRDVDEQLNEREQILRTFGGKKTE